MSLEEVVVSFPSAGLIRVQSERLFRDADSPECRTFIARVFLCEAVSSLSITAQNAPRADLCYCPCKFALPDVARRLKALLVRDWIADGKRAPNGSEVLRVSRATLARDDRGIVRYYRQGSLVTGWETKSHQPGRVRFRNPILFRKSALCNAIERELTGVSGIDRFSTNSITSGILVRFDEAQLTKEQLIEILDGALAGVQHVPATDKMDIDLPLCTASIPLAASAQFAAPVLIPVAVMVYAPLSRR
jgi:Cu2+-exporting ATPase